MLGHRRSKVHDGHFDSDSPVAAQPPPTRRGRFLSGGDIGNRLARILAWPLVAVVLLLAIVMVRNAEDYTSAAQNNGSVTLALAVQNLVQEIQVERGLTSGLLGGNVGFRDELSPQRKLVDEERAEVSQLVDEGAEGASGVRAAMRQFESLEETRSQVDTGSAERAATFQYYTDRITALNDVDFGLDRSPDSDLRQGVAALDALGDYKEQTAQKRAYLNGVFSASGFVSGEYIQYASVTAAQQAALTQYNRQATAAQQELLDTVLDTGAASEAAYFETVALAAADGRVIQVNPQSWWSALTTVIDGIREVQQSVGEDIQSRAGDLRTEAQLQLVGVSALALFCLIGGFVVVASATKSITVPLATLSSEAEALAAVHLPEVVAQIQSDPKGTASCPPIEVPERASSEIRSVAVALDKVQDTARILATEQALMRHNTTQSLANLGRRNQNLIRRQLGFISRLEQEETDPGALSNLFELDHLATRMRRNAESLLVLVGESTPRTWSVALPIADVIRAALSEVEEYRRVSLRRIDEGYLVGTFVTSVAHMLAELLENGLTFSPPDLDVEIQGRKVGNDYLIAITDQGVGMDPDKLDQANARLRGEENFLLAPAQFLGHYVVGQLARQMSIDVQIARSPVTGITARITLPSNLLSRPGELGPGPAGKPSVTRPERISGVSVVSALNAAGPPPRSLPDPRRQANGTGRLTTPDAFPRWEQPTAPLAIESILPPPRPVPSQHDRPLGRPEMGPDLQTASTSPISSTPPGVSDWWSQPPNPPVEPDPNLTRNGLVKRTLRSGQAPAESVARPIPTDQTIRRGGPPVDRSPDDLRSRLTTLRAGVDRGETARITRSTPTDWEGRGHDYR